MAITYEGAGALFENASAATTQTPAYPAGIAADDIIVLVVSVSSATAPTNPAGFTSQGSGSAGGSSPAYRVSTKVATGSESGTVTVTTPNVVGKSQMFLLRGVDTTTLLNAAVTQLSSSTAITAYNLPTQTTSVTGCLLFGVVIGNAATGTFTQPTVPAAFTEPSDDNSPLPHLGVAYLIWSGSGATGTVNFVRSASTRGAGILLAFNPDPGSTPISASDTGSGADDAAVDADLDATDTGSGVDTASVAVGTSASDTGSGADSSSVAAALTGSDTGSGANSASVAAGLAASDTATGADTGAVAVAVTLADTGTGVDAISVNTGGTPIASSDTGTGSDTASLAASITAGDTGAGADAASVSAALTATDAGTGANTASVAAGITGADTGSGANSASVAVAASLGDTAAASEGFSIQVILSASDTGSGTDSISAQTSGDGPTESAPASRTYTGVWDDRTYTGVYDDRTYTADYDDRTYTWTPEDGA